MSPSEPARALQRLDDDALARALQARPLWRRDGDALCRDLTFDDFVAAFSFMTATALVAERMNHHPEWSNVYGTVRVRLTTHDAGGVTDLDLELAAAIDRLAPST
jgi:4a-hydroxytetrahydrobiopterin dehydratase